MVDIAGESRDITNHHSFDMPPLFSLLASAASACLLLPALATATALNDLPTWDITDRLTMDPARPAPDGSPSFKLDPKGKAVLKLRDTDGAGRLTLFIYDDGKAASPVKTRNVGPRWGFTQANGRVFVGGILYAPYLHDGGSYCLVDSDTKNWFSLQYVAARTPGWRTWDFVFDPDKGLKVSLDGKPVTKFDWGKTKAEGFNGLVLLGDETTSDTPQTLWVGGIDYTLGGKMNVKPAPASPPAVAPKADPQEALNIPGFNTERMSQHPRLLLTSASLPKLREFYLSDAGKVWREKMLAYLPACSPPEKIGFLTDATDGQRQGVWKVPTVALHYLLTGEVGSKEKAIGFLRKFNSLPQWETGVEPDSGMSSSNIMIGAALAYDWLYEDLDADFREQFRIKLVQQARKLYYGGHLTKNPGAHYWQGDPGNNHRWHRNAGLALAVLAAYDGAPEANWLLNRTCEELEFIAKWLPEDGSSHESLSYLIFGGNHLTLAFQASDECLGTHLLDVPFFKTAGNFRMHLSLSSFAGTLDFGDFSGGGNGGYNNFLLKAASHHRLVDLMDGVRKLPGHDFGWFSILWDDPTVTGGDYKQLPLTFYSPDVGIATYRDSWEPGGVAALFKCGLLGGKTLNKYRNENNFRYINVAHDDPDANSFIFFVGNEILAATDQYSKHKQTSHHNSILINGIGQMPPGGKEEGGTWTQPGKGDLTNMAKIVSQGQKDGFSFIEGEAGGSYLAVKRGTNGSSRPALERYRRLFVWVPQSYILVLDDIRSPEPVEITWLMQGPSVRHDQTKPNVFHLAGENESCDFQVVSDQALEFKIVDSTADNYGKTLGYKQLRASAKTPQLRVAGVFNPWKKESLSVDLKVISPEEAEVTVTAEGLKNRFRWKFAANSDSASQLLQEL